MPPYVPPDRWARIQELDLRYWLCGSPADPPLVLLHGLGGSLEAWRHNIPALQEKHLVLAFELPGAGRSMPPPRYPPDTLGWFAGVLHELLARLAIVNPVLVGSSLGGTVAIEYVQHHPEGVRGLVLVNSAGFTTAVGLPLRVLSLPLVGELLSRPNRAAAQRSLLGLVGDPNVVTAEDVEIAYTLASLPGAQHSFLAMLRVYCDFRGIKRSEVVRIVDSLGQISQPVLLVWGRGDQILPPTSAAIALERLRNARLVIMEGCAHLPYAEQPEVFNGILFDFLAGLTATAV